MKLILSKDNTVTYFNELYNETYHSLTGAKEEAFKKFVEPVLEKIKDKKELVVFDVCFGLGYNTASLIENVNSAVKLKIYCFENDVEILKVIPSLDDSLFKSYKKIKKFVTEFLESGKTEYSEGNVTLILLFGDAREKIGAVPDSAFLVFLDPFSPKKCPHLWTREFFSDINNKMGFGSVLTTYSCARIVRENLLAVGFSVFNGPKVKRRGPSTIAIKK